MLMLTPVSFEALTRGFAWDPGYDSWLLKTRFAGLPGGETA